MRMTPTRRRGLTLVELLVAAALSLVIMTVLASAFQTGMDTLSQLKSVGELQDKLRVASERIKDDLKAPHFNDPALAGGKLSAIRYDTGAANPASGMFRIVQVGSAYQEFLQDPLADQFFPSSVREYSTVANPAPKTSAKIVPPLNSVSLYQARPAGNAHAMQFAVKLDGKTRQKVFTALRPVSLPNRALDNRYDNLVQSPATTYATRWAVVSYFLVDSGTKTGNSTPLFNLHRRVQLVAEEPGAILPNADPNFSVRPIGPNGTGPFAVNTVGDLKNLVNRPGAAATLGTIAPPPISPALATSLAFNAFAPAGDGSDVVLANVISFEIKANWDGGFRKLAQVPVMAGDLPNFDYPFDDLPPATQSALGGSSQYDTVPRVFDTAIEPTAADAPLGITTPIVNTRVRINAVQIKLRVWDPQNHTSRQMTVVQDM